MNTQELLASMGLQALKRAVLIVLCEQTVSWSPNYRQSLGLKKIRQQLGTQQTGGFNHLIRGILGHLIDDGYVNKIGDNQWQITQEGVSIIEG